FWWQSGGGQHVGLQARPWPAGCAERGQEGGAAHDDRVAPADELWNPCGTPGTKPGMASHAGRPSGVATNPSTLTPMRDRISIGGAPSRVLLPPETSEPAPGSRHAWHGGTPGARVTLGHPYVSFFAVPVRS